MAEDKQDDLGDLLPDREVELSNGQKVTVCPLRFTQLAKGSMHIERVIAAALQSGVLTEEGDINLSGLLGLVAAAGGHIDELILMSARHEPGPGEVSGEPVNRDWLDTVSVEDGLELTKALILANWRESVAKKLESLSQEVRAILEAGATSSNGSSPTDTYGPISSSTPSVRSSAS